MTTDRTKPPSLKWRTLKQVYNRYLDEAELPDGRTAREIIDQALEQRGLETHCFQMTGAKPADRPEYEAMIKPIDDLIRHTEAGIRKFMMDQAVAIQWVAFGRRHPDADIEVIPARYWPFLALDMDNDVAAGEGMTFRGIRCLFSRDIPADHPYRDIIRAAQKRPAAPMPANDSAKPPTPPPAEDTPRSGAPGRPTSMHLIEAEFERRAESGAIESSLNKQAEVLEQWLARAHPDMPGATAKTIANRLRETYRSAKQSS